MAKDKSPASSASSAPQPSVEPPGPRTRSMSHASVSPSLVNLTSDEDSRAQSEGDTSLDSLDRTVVEGSLDEACASPVPGALHAPRVKHESDSAAACQRDTAPRDEPLGDSQSLMFSGALPSVGSPGGDSGNSNGAPSQDGSQSLFASGVSVFERYFVNLLRSGGAQPGSVPGSPGMAFKQDSTVAEAFARAFAIASQAGLFAGRQPSGAQAAPHPPRLRRLTHLLRALTPSSSRKTRRSRLPSPSLSRRSNSLLPSPALPLPTLAPGPRPRKLLLVRRPPIWALLQGSPRSTRLIRRRVSRPRCWLSTPPR